MMLTKSQVVFFQILRSALWKRPVEVPDDFSDWGMILKLAKTQALIGLVSEVMLTTPSISECLPDNLITKLREFPKIHIGTHLSLNNALVLVVTTMRKQGIEPVLLKGQGLARCYPVAELRQCGDIDLYVGEENYEKAYDAILPIASEIEEKSKIWKWMHFDAKVGSAILEIHQKADYMRSRRGDKLYQKYMRLGLTENLCPINFAGTVVMTPNDTYNAFYVFYHLWRHFSSSGVGLRQFCDWTCFLHTHAGKMDLAYLEEMLEKLGFMKIWQVFGCFIVKYLALPENEFPFYNSKYVDKADRVCDFVMKDGNFGVLTGYYRVRKYGYIREKYISFKCHTLRIFRMYMILPQQTLLHIWYVLRDGILTILRDMRCRHKENS